MLILAMDTSAKAASCALWRDDTLLGEYFLNAALTHSQTILPMVEHLLHSARVTPAQVECYAVAAGPGSFTGLRIGIAAAKGMAFATGAPCAAVSTLEALAENMAATPGVVVPVMDARRQQVYTACFSAQNGVLTRMGEDAALSLQELHGRLAALAPQPVTLVGDGAVLCKAAMQDLAHVAVAPVPLRVGRAASVAAVAARLPPERLCSARDLAPAYLRLPQAERERLAKLER